ncbi:MAG TPA: DUF4333 domain-containing protein [Kofleriaceae bacterium]|jgi:hypothetical protein
MAKRSMLWGACAATFLVGCSFSASCGTRHIDTEKAQTFISDALAKEIGVAPTGVSCPDSIPVKKGTTFRCTAGFAGGISATVTLTQSDDSGYVVITQADGVAGAKPIEAALIDGIKKQSGQAVTADCGAKVRAVHTGDTAECKVTTPSGEVVRTAVTFTDDHGGFDWKPVSAAPPPPADDAPKPAE